MQKKRWIKRRVVNSLLVVMMLFFVSGNYLYAADFPTKPLNIIVPFGAGGMIDLTARLFSNYAMEYFGQPFVVKLLPGGGGAIGSNEVANADPDGYTLLAGHANCNTVLPAVRGRGKGPGDLQPVCRISTSYSAYYVQKDAPWKTFEELVSWAKANPGKLIYGNAGTMSASDFSWRWFENRLGITTRNVPHEGGAQATTALLGGHIHISRSSPGHAYPQWKAGKIRPILVAGPKRFADMPDIPCMLELGYDMKGADGVWIGIFAPNKTPRPIIDKLAAGFKKMTEDKRAIAAYKKMGDDFNYLGPDEFDKFWKEGFILYKEMAKKFMK
jgi:tripartite-type tricarboxylate transporter receptor subunit TctC